MGGIPNPCAGCGDPACACCFTDSADIERLAGTGNTGDCWQLGIADDAVGTHLCADAAAGPPLADGDQVVICDGGAPVLADYETACTQFNALAPAAGPALPGDEIIVVDGLTCVRKTVTPSDCASAPEPVIDAGCVGADLAPVFCSTLTNDLRTWPRSQTASTDLILAGWAANLLFLAQGVPTVMATSGVATITNPSCHWPMTVMLAGAPGVLRWTGPSGAWFQCDIDERVNGGAWVGIHSHLSDYRGAGVGPDLDDARAMASWNRTYLLAPAGALTYEWRMILTRLHPNVPNINGVVQNFSSRVTIIGGST